MYIVSLTRFLLVYIFGSTFNSKTRTLADPGGGATGLRPPNGRGPTIFYVQNAIPPLTKSKASE